MTELACWSCGNFLTFVQIAEGGDERLIDLVGQEPRIGEWVPGSQRSEGLLCRECGTPLEEDVPAWLSDERVAVAPPGEVDARGLGARLESRLGDRISDQLIVRARPPVTAPVPVSLVPALDRKIRQRFGEEIYIHQAAAIAAARSGGHVVQATSAGSGKSLAFVVPVLDALLRDPTATALFVYPSVSLVSDQLLGIRSWASEVEELAPGVLELRFGRTSHDVWVGRHDSLADDADRSKVRRGARIVLTTPDSLHAAVLRFSLHAYRDGTSWRRFFRGLHYVVLDEIHQYGGSFGSAVAMVLRRLRRVAADHGRTPIFLGASATIGNPGQLMSQLTGEPDIAVVDEDGSPRSERVILIGRPSDEAGTAAVSAAAEAIGRPDGPAPVRTLIFADSRQRVDQLAASLQRELGTAGWEDPERLVTVVRGTLDGRSRLEAEGDLRDGTALGIVSTSALELGVDVASLGLAVLDGLPASAASFEQRAGRVGRAGAGVVLVLPGDRPVERYLSSDPDRIRSWLEGIRPTVVVDTTNAELVRLFGLVPGQCEMQGIAFADAQYFGETAVESWLAGAMGAPTRRSRGGDYFEVELGVGEPFQSLRAGAATETFDVRVGESGSPGRTIGRVDRLSGMTDAYVGAIFRDGRGRAHRVTRVDSPSTTVLVSPAPDAGGWTRGVLESEVIELEERLPALQRGETHVAYRNLQIEYSATLARVSSGGPATWQPIARPWPALHQNTTGLAVRMDRKWFPEGDHEPAVRGVRNALGSVVPMLLTCGPQDVMTADSGRTVYVHDRGGPFGWTRPLHEQFPAFAGQAWQLVASCRCETDGCPSCVIGPDGKPASKSAAESLLRNLTTCWVS